MAITGSIHVKEVPHGEPFLHSNLAKKLYFS